MEGAESTETMEVGLIAAAAGGSIDAAFVFKNTGGRGPGAVAAVGGFEGAPRGAILVYTVLFISLEWSRFGAEISTLRK